MRIARALALAGIDSRRKCEVHVTNGAVTVNGEVIRDLAMQVDPEKDAILFRGRPLCFHKPIYYILNKPEGYTTTVGDPHARKTVYELLPRHLISGSRQPRLSHTRVFAVGRLDRDSMGLLLFTNDGELAHRLMHPRYEVGKWYEVKLSRAFESKDRIRLAEGVRLSDGTAKPEKVHQISARVVRLLLREGKKREVRRLFERLNYKVLKLCRTSLGPISLGPLPLGRGRFLTSTEVGALRRLAFKN